MAIDLPPIRVIDYDIRESQVYVEQDLDRMKINAMLVCADGQRFNFDDLYDAECFDDKREKSLKALRAVGYVPV